MQVVAQYASLMDGFGAGVELLATLTFSKKNVFYTEMKKKEKCKLTAYS